MQGRIPALTGIRGVAASWVVLLHYHALLSQLHVLPMWAPSRVMLAGYLAVDLFFILSGFVLAMSYVERMRQGPALDALTGFVLNRVFRIMPLNTLCLLAMLVLVTFIDRHYWTTFPLSWSSFVPALLLVQAWGVGSATAWNLPAWSLSAEWLAYAAFPVLVVAVAWTSSRRLAVAGWFLPLLALVALMIRFGGATLDHTWLLGLPRCLLQFAAGMMLWRWMRLGAVSGRIADLMLVVGLAIVAVAVGVPRLQLLAPFGFSALIVACAGRGRWAERLMGGRLIEWLGEISFSLYLTHFILLGLFVWLATILSVAQAAVAVRVAFAAGALATVYLVSWATWRFLELPAQAAGRRLNARRLGRGASAPASAREPARGGNVGPVADGEVDRDRPQAGRR